MSGDLADVIRRLLRALLAACRLPSDGVAGTGGRRLTAMGSRAGQYRELRALGAAGPPGSLPAGSFISCGAFAGPGRAQPHARLPGAVLRAAPRGCTVTGKRFTVAGSPVP